MERAMITDPHLMLELHAARLVNLRAEAAHVRMAHELRRHASAPGRRWWHRAVFARAPETC
jgi:hypothetical protein